MENTNDNTVETRESNAPSQEELEQALAYFESIDWDNAQLVVMFETHNAFL